MARWAAAIAGLPACALTSGCGGYLDEKLTVLGCDGVSPAWWYVHAEETKLDVQGAQLLAPRDLENEPVPETGFHSPRLGSVDTRAVSQAFDEETLRCRGARGDQIAALTMARAILDADLESRTSLADAERFLEIAGRHSYQACPYGDPDRAGRADYCNPATMTAIFQDGLPAAHYELALLRESGKSPVANRQEARSLKRLAARQGHGVAWLDLHGFFAEPGPPRDPATCEAPSAAYIYVTQLVATAKDTTQPWGGSIPLPTSPNIDDFPDPTESQFGGSGLQLYYLAPSALKLFNYVQIDRMQCWASAGDQMAQTAIALMLGDATKTLSHQALTALRNDFISRSATPTDDACQVMAQEIHHLPNCVDPYTTAIYRWGTPESNLLIFFTELNNSQSTNEIHGLALRRLKRALYSGYLISNRSISE